MNVLRNNTGYDISFFAGDFYLLRSVNHIHLDKKGDYGKNTVVFLSSDDKKTSEDTMVKMSWWQFWTLRRKLWVADLCYFWGTGRVYSGLVILFLMLSFVLILGAGYWKSQAEVAACEEAAQSPQASQPQAPTGISAEAWKP